MIRGSRGWRSRHGPRQLARQGEEVVADAHLLPAAGTGEKAGNAIKAYILSDPNPTATIIFGGTKVGVQPSPVVAAFSSRGPNTVTRGVLKPDIIASGVNIPCCVDGRGRSDRARGGLPASGVQHHLQDVDVVPARERTGGVPQGSASGVEPRRHQVRPHDHRLLRLRRRRLPPRRGLGPRRHAVRPWSWARGPPKGNGPRARLRPHRRRLHRLPLCALNYSGFRLAILTRRTDFACDAARADAVEELNYPSFAVTFPSSGGEASVTKHRRTLTNVGEPGTYKVTVRSLAGAAAEGVKVEVEPEELIFGVAGEKRNYTVSFSAAAQPQGSSGFGRLEWSDGKHIVSSPVVFMWA